MTPTEVFLQHAAKTFFACAWAEAEEEAGQEQGGEIMERLPSQTDPAALHAASTLRMGLEALNDRSLEEMLLDIENMGEGDRPETMEMFGHYAAMQAMGTGVGLHDAFGKDVYDLISVPYVEFGSHSLEKDYF